MGRPTDVATWFEARCHGCRWESSSRNALGTAARHHDSTGHYVVVDIVRAVAYGQQGAPMPGQTVFDVPVAT